MKVAIPTIGKKGLEELIGEHFGRTETYTLVDTETGEVSVLDNTSHHMGGQGYPPELLHAAGAEVLLCQGLGSRAIQMFRDSGIKVYVGAFGTVKDALESFKSGELSEASEDGACSRHAFRSPLHDAGGCGRNGHKH